MGQKTHPIGLRLGLHRKWSSSWFNPSLGFSITKNKLSPFLAARGGTVSGGVEAFLVNIIRRRVIPFTLLGKNSELRNIQSKTTDFPLQTKIQTPHRFFPVSIQILKGSVGGIFIVFFYVKLYGRDNTQLC